MINTIKQFFEARLLTKEPTTQATNASIQCATAALLIELAKADFAADGVEYQFINKLLRETFDIGQETLDTIIKLAETASTDANDLFQFTALINRHYNNAEKTLLLENCWRLAYADGRLDKYEEQLIRKIVGLIHLPPSAFVKAKLKVKQVIQG